MATFVRCAWLLAVVFFLTCVAVRADDPAPAPAPAADQTAFPANDVIPPSPTSLIKPGEKVAFLGDSITEAGWTNTSGYVRLVVTGLKTNGVNIVPQPAGVSGNTSAQMLARLKEVVDKKPDWLLVMAGVDEIAHANSTVTLDKYKENMTAIVTQAQAANIKVMIVTTTVITEDLTNASNKKLADYNTALRTLATDTKALVSDVNGAMQTALQAAQQAPAGPRKTAKTPGMVLTKYDGIHMNSKGDFLIAKTILMTVGLSEEELAKAVGLWQKLDPSTITKTTSTVTDTTNTTTTTQPAPTPTRARRTRRGG